MKTGTKSYNLALALIFIISQLACDRILPMKMKLSGRQKSFEMRSKRLRKTCDPLLLVALLGPHTDNAKLALDNGHSLLVKCLFLTKVGAKHPNQLKCRQFSTSIVVSEVIYQLSVAQDPHRDSVQIRKGGTRLEKAGTTLQVCNFVTISTNFKH